MKLFIWHASDDSDTLVIAEDLDQAKRLWEEGHKPLTFYLREPDSVYELAEGKYEPTCWV